VTRSDNHFRAVYIKAFVINWTQLTSCGLYIAVAYICRSFIIAKEMPTKRRTKPREDAEYFVRNKIDKSGLEAIFVDEHTG